MKNFNFIVLLFIISFTQAQIVNIPDANFKNALVNTLCVDFDGDNVLDSDVDTNDDGEIQISEAEAVLNLRVQNNGINSLEGIENFTNIIKLYCGNNNLTNLNLSQNQNLELLYCRWNNLTSIDVTQNSKLILLWCSTNQLTTLDVSQNPNLESLACGRNSLSSLDVSQNPNLEWLVCEENQLTSLDVSLNLDLYLLECSTNQLANLDISQNHNLEWLLCSNNSSLSYLNANNSNNQNMEALCTLNCENLFCIKVDNAIYANEQNTLVCGCVIGGEGWCKDEWAEYNEECILGLTNLESVKVIIYPNPVQNTLKITSDISFDTIKIYSASGQFICQTHNNQVYTSDLSSGLYFAKLFINGQTIIKKFVKY